MTVFSTRTGWTFSAHSQQRSYERGIPRNETLTAIRGSHCSYPSTHADSPARVVVGSNGVVAIVDEACRMVITVYRAAVS